MKKLLSVTTLNTTKVQLNLQQLTDGVNSIIPFKYH